MFLDCNSSPPGTQDTLASSPSLTPLKDKDLWAPIRFSFRLNFTRDRK